MGNKILLIEDTTELAALITLYLNKEGMEIKPVESGEEALVALESFQPELVLLDLNLPGMGGFEFLQIFRKTSQVPILIISARDSEEDIIQGLGGGADEYITKPFSPKVLVARIQAMLRRAGSTSETTAQEQTFQFGPFHLYCDRYLLTRNGQRIPLSSKEFSILAHLVRNAGIPSLPRPSTVMSGAGPMGTSPPWRSTSSGCDERLRMNRQIPNTSKTSMA